MITYDTEKDDWSEELIKFAGEKHNECFIKTPKL